jgi:glycosyltransferase involved in cell wall biosynthesis
MSNSEPPFFSVVIPTCDRPSVLEKLLQMFAPGAQLGFSNLGTGQYELIVTDDSQDREPQQTLCATCGWANYVRGPRAGAGANRNAGATAARGRWLVFLDDDCMVGTGYLAALADCIARTDAVVVEGQISCPDKTGWPWRSEPENLTGGLFWSGNLAVRSDIFAALGGFDRQLERGEDLYFAHQVRMRGLRTAFCREAVARHFSEPLSWRRYVARVQSSRWQLMVRLKSAPQPPGELGWLASAHSVGLYWLPLVARQCWAPVRDALRESRWPSLPVVCAGLLNVIYLPAMLPYLIFWEREFRHALAAVRPRLEISNDEPRG